MLEFYIIYINRLRNYGQELKEGKYMKYKNLFIIMLGITLITLAGCRTSPVYNVTDQTITTNIESPTEEHVQKAIIRAGSGLGWNMNSVSPGHIVAVLHLRTHMAKVDIKYSTEKYSITYNDSENLNYDGTIIHTNYNGWVQNLDRAIQTQLNTL